MMKSLASAGRRAKGPGDEAACTDHSRQIHEPPARWRIWGFFVYFFWCAFIPGLAWVVNEARTYGTVLQTPQQWIVENHLTQILAQSLAGTVTNPTINPKLPEGNDLHGNDSVYQVIRHRAGYRSTDSDSRASRAMIEQALRNRGEPAIDLDFADTQAKGDAYIAMDPVDGEDIILKVSFTPRDLDLNFPTMLQYYFHRYFWVILGCIPGAFLLLALPRLQSPSRNRENSPPSREHSSSDHDPSPDEGSSENGPDGTECDCAEYGDEAVFSLNRMQRILRINERMARILCVQTEMMVGIHIEEIVESPQLLSHIKTVGMRATHPEKRIMGHVKSPQGTRIPVQFRVIARSKADGPEIVIHFQARSGERESVNPLDRLLSAPRTGG